MAAFGPFELLGRLGSGATAEVHVAAGPNPSGEELVALKILLPHVAEDARSRRALLKEAGVGELLQHPNIVSVFDVGEAEDRPYLVLELVRGQSLFALVRRMREDGKGLSVSEACSVVHQAAVALDHAHAVTGASGEPLGLVHRDVNPQNLIVSEDGTVKVADFGLATATLAAATRTGGMKGKLAYMPPEQLEGGALDRRVDVFALGSVFWELLCHQRVYPGRTEQELIQQALSREIPRADALVPTIPRELADVIAQCLQRDLRRRVPSCGVIADAVQPFATAEARRKLGGRITTLFPPLPRTAAEARALQERKARRTAPAPPRPAPAPPPPRAELEDDTLREQRRARERDRPIEDDPPEDTVREQRPKPRRPARTATPPREERPPDRAVLVNPLLAGRPARRAPKYAPLPDDGVDHRVGYSEDTSISRLLRLGRPKGPTPLAVVGGVLGAVALIVLVAVGYLRIVRPRVQPPKAAAATAPASARPEQPSAERPTSGRADPPPARRAREGTVQLQSDVPAFVSHRGRDLGMTPITLTLPAGPARLELRTLDGAATREVEVQVPAGGRVTRRVELR